MPSDSRPSTCSRYPFKFRPLTCIFERAMARRWLLANNAAAASSSSAVAGTASLSSLAAGGGIQRMDRQSQVHLPTDKWLVDGIPALTRRHGADYRTAARIAGICAGLMLVTGCTSLSLQHDRFVAGWRSGVVLDTGMHHITPAIRAARDCRTHGATAHTDGAREVFVRYVRGPTRYWYQVSSVPSHSRVDVGDVVMINVQQCELPIVVLPPRVTS